MKDEIVNFEIADLAKEIGFNEFCFCSYTKYLKDGGGNYDFIKHKKGDIEFNSDFILSGSNKIHKEISNNYYNLISAPTQSLLQRWLREKYNIHITVNATNTKTPDDSFEVLVSTQNERDYSHFGYLNYEKALADGLLNGLLLIKNKLYAKKL